MKIVRLLLILLTTNLAFAAGCAKKTLEQLIINETNYSVQVEIAYQVDSFSTLGNAFCKNEKFRLEPHASRTIESVCCMPTAVISTIISNPEQQALGWYGLAQGRYYVQETRRSDVWRIRARTEDEINKGLPERRKFLYVVEQR